MKYLASILLSVLALTITVAAQQTASPGARVATEIIASSSTAVVKGAPYSADAISESVQLLADGNKISHSNTTRMYRDSEGRTRRESSSSNGGRGFGAPIAPSAPGFDFAFSGFGFGDAISIFDPVSNLRYSLNPTAKTAQKMRAQFGMVEGAFFGTVGQAVSTAARTQVTANAAKRATEAAVVASGQLMTPATKTQIDATTAERNARAGAVSGGFATTTIVGGSGGSVFSYSPGKAESLGTRDFEGVTAEGSRTVTTIPAGAIGNENPIEIVYERWYSKELQLTVYSRHTDPRFGEQIYRLANISRNEPDRSLFAPPADYKIVSESFNLLAPKAQQ
jgi:hypothetical protein